MAKTGGAKGGPSRPRQTEGARFFGRVRGALYRLAAAWLFAKIHRFLDDELAEIFEPGTVIHSAAHGGTKVAFFVVYAVLLLEMIWCFMPEDTSAKRG